MRIRNLNPKPSDFTGNPLMLTRWKTGYANHGEYFTVNIGQNAADSVKTSFDIIGNPDIKAYMDVAKWIMSLPDCTLCFSMRAASLTDLTVRLVAASENNNSFWNKGTLNSVRLAAGQSATLSCSVGHEQGKRNCAQVIFILDDTSMQENTDVAQVSDVTIVIGEEKTIMDYLDVGAFSARTAPYTAVGGGYSS